MLNKLEGQGRCDADHKPNLSAEQLKYYGIGCNDRAVSPRFIN